jgi:translation initiation factor IF-3
MHFFEYLSRIRSTLDFWALFFWRRKKKSSESKRKSHASTITKDICFKIITNERDSNASLKKQVSFREKSDTYHTWSKGTYQT